MRSWRPPFPRRAAPMSICRGRLAAYVGFAFAWAEFWIVRPGNVGAIAFVHGPTMPASCSSRDYRQDPTWRSCPARRRRRDCRASPLLNAVGLRAGTWTQNLLTAAKLAGAGGRRDCRDGVHAAPAAAPYNSLPHATLDSPSAVADPGHVRLWRLGRYVVCRGRGARSGAEHLAGLAPGHRGCRRHLPARSRWRLSACWALAAWRGRRRSRPTCMSLRFGARRRDRDQPAGDRLVPGGDQRHAVHRGRGSITPWARTIPVFAGWEPGTSTGRSAAIARSCKRSSRWAWSWRSASMPGASSGWSFSRRRSTWGFIALVGVGLIRPAAARGDRAMRPIACRFFPLTPLLFSCRAGRWSMRRSTTPWKSRLGEAVLGGGRDPRRAGCGRCRLASATAAGRQQVPAGARFGKLCRLCRLGQQKRLCGGRCRR